MGLRFYHNPSSCTWLDTDFFRSQLKVYGVCSALNLILRTGIGATNPFQGEEVNEITDDEIFLRLMERFERELITAKSCQSPRLTVTL
jgi:hypothetical protein